MRKQVIQAILDKKLIAIARGIPVDMAGSIVDALQQAGIVLLETTFDLKARHPTDSTSGMIRELISAGAPNMLIGAGTVLTVDQVKAAHDAGAAYIVSPNVNPAVIGETRKLGMVSIPGAMTPTEIIHAWESGADFVKLFPADDLGCRYIRNICAPISHIPLLAAGVITPEAIPGFLDAGITAFGTAATIFPSEHVGNRNFTGMTALASQLVHAIDTWCRENQS
ncbi:MAG: bifunctional 4-hydroxy-2-oxoglutarate aldolase/2-dehydro-3-deoxy-phosphogluconate aldolase [Clostridiaceae bacterium]|jgi:2-dehydro-3-deoxyphosphogluconate aldolase/(4S)-4-hydroxy-2-oxoglutarate aldolase|nr:bifunctional 4-hydroxy-2-oxoglutarate aldolase/2-dehydro-3-deoxy-phosphogluconate aldolase [Clostridiaceae bacterium]